MTKNSKSDSLGREVYEGAAGIGRGISLFFLIISCIITLFLIGYGTYLIIHPSGRNVQATATIKPGGSCPAMVVDNQIKYQCNLDISFKTDTGEQIDTHIFFDSNVDYSRSTSMVVYYDPKNPTDVSNDKGPGAAAGAVMIFVGLIMVAISYLIYWGARKSKTFAAGVTVVEGVRMIAR